jgi:hypothetical protein
MNGPHTYAATTPMVTRGYAGRQLQTLRRIGDVNRIRLGLIGASAVIALGAVGTAAAGRSDYADARPEMSTGVTQTQSTAPTTLATPVAVPSITGPAALPPEEQGLPG